MITIQACEDRSQAVVIVLRPAIERMIVAVGTTQFDPQECRGHEFPFRTCIDRLAMMLAGVKSLREVLLFPAMRS